MEYNVTSFHYKSVLFAFILIVSLNDQRSKVPIIWVVATAPFIMKNSANSNRIPLPLATLAFCVRLNRPLLST